VGRGARPPAAGVSRLSRRERNGSAWRLLCDFETWFELASTGQFDGQGDHHTPKPYVRHAFRKYLGCGIFAHGFARASSDAQPGEDTQIGPAWDLAAQPEPDYEVDQRINC